MSMARIRARRAAAKQREIAKHAPAVILLILLMAVGISLLPRLSALLAPPCRQDIVLYLVSDNSGSAVSWNIREEIAREQIQIAQAIGERPVETTLLRLAADPVLLYHGTNDTRALSAIYQQHYLHTAPDPTPGTHLSRVLRLVRERAEAYPQTLVVAAIGADSYEDVAETHREAEALGKRSNVLLIHHAVPIHDPVHDAQLHLREDSQQALAPLGGNAAVIGKMEFSGLVSDWLPRKLSEKGFHP